MSGALKSGLLFALVGLIGVVALSILFTFIPAGGAVLCGPLIAMIVGTAAGYFGVRWSAASAGVGTGVLAGTVAGVGTLIGAVVVWVVLIRIAQSMPGFEQQLQEAFRSRQPGLQLGSGDLSALVNIAAPILGLCFGLINLLLALGLGALGGWLATRRRAQQLAPATATPLEPPPLGPPPLDPPG